jgi:hypothetical protein
MPPDDEFERKLFLAQKAAERKCFEAGVEGFYICSFSSRTVVYKGLLNAPAGAQVLPRPEVAELQERVRRSSTSGTRPTRSRPGTWPIRSG